MKKNEDLYLQLEKILRSTDIKFYKQNHIQYCDVPFSFDIETSSFNVDGLKQGIMYVWQFAISDKYVFVGRYWNEFIGLLDAIQKILGLNNKRYIYIYVHNLAFEFQFMRKWLKVDNMLATSERKPIKFSTENGFWFKCTYFLTNSSLDRLGVNHDLPHKKAVGNLDYNLIRHSKTPLTEDEITYIINDVILINEYIQMVELPKYKHLHLIPNTATGKVRKHCFADTVAMYSEGGTDNHGAIRYKKLIHNDMVLQDEVEFNLLNKAYMGGFTHANAHYVNEVIKDVESQDFTSSYPASMVTSNNFPIGKGHYIEDLTSKEYFENYAWKYCCVMEVTIMGLQEKLTQDSPLSLSKCCDTINAITNNGRLHSCDRLTTWCTELDLKTYLEFYDMIGFHINRMFFYKKGYLPKKLIISILKLYEDKTTLKGVEGQEANYLNKKEMLNSVYGMCVTNPFKDTVVYSDEWDTEPIDFDKKLKEYNNDKKRFLFYAWGVYISAISRRRLFQAIKNVGDDYIYSDTDSIKFCHPERHREFFDAYNDIIRMKIEQSASDNHIPIELFSPKTVQGEEKTIGLFDFDGHYDEFKTLGAKRYMVNKDGKYTITVAGLKKTAVNYITTVSDNPFDAFSDDLYVPAAATGKLCHTYIDEFRSGKVTDYLGEEAAYFELSSINLEPIDYDMSISQEYINFILNVKETYIHE